MLNEQFALERSLLLPAHPGGVYVHDASLRDGRAGNGINPSPAQAIEILRLLDDSGLIHVAEAGYPGSNSIDDEIFKRAKNMSLKKITMCAFTATPKPGTKAEDDMYIQATADTEVPIVTIVGKGWLYQVERILRTDEDESLRMLEDAITFFTKRGRRVIWDMEHGIDGLLGNPDGEDYPHEKRRSQRSVDYSLKACRVAIDAGAESIVACDTRGGTLTWDIETAIRTIIAQFGSEIPIGIHTHDDAELAVAGTLHAIRAGARWVQGCINRGIGERTGNANELSVIADHQFKMIDPTLAKLDLTGLTQLSCDFGLLVGRPVDPKQPYTGYDADTHKGGPHGAAVRIEPAAYEHIPPEKVGNERRFSVSFYGGAGLISSAMETFNPPVTFTRTQAREIAKAVAVNEGRGFKYELAPASFEMLARRMLGHQPSFILSLDDEPRLTSNIAFQLDTAPYADSDYRVFKDFFREPFSVPSMFDKLQSLLRVTYPYIGTLQMSDYKAQRDEEILRVLLSVNDGHDLIKTVGADDNILAKPLTAALLAIQDVFEYTIIHHPPY